MDCSQVQSEFLNIIQKNEDLLEKLRTKYKHILVDEYQDTDFIQDEIFKLLSHPLEKITLVGDEDQSIYGFRGATPENLINFKKRYPNIKLVKLEKNFRSTKNIVSVFDDFMSNERIIPKKIYTDNGEFLDPVYIKCSDYDQEAEKISSLIQNMVNNNEVEYSDIAILFNSVKYHSKELVKKLDEKNIPYNSEEDLLDKREIVDILLMFINISNYNLTEEEKEKINKKIFADSPLFNISQETRNELLSEFDPVYLLEDITKLKLKRLKVKEKDIEILIMLKEFKDNFNLNTQTLKIFYEVMKITGYEDRLLEKVASKDKNAILIFKNLGKLVNLITIFETFSKTKNLINFLNYIIKTPMYAADKAHNNRQEDAVNIMTLHKSKGLEFPVVIIPRVTNKVFGDKKRKEEYLMEIPHKFILNNSLNETNERERLFYVGMSRAENVLILTSISSPSKNLVPSNFIKNLKHRFIDEKYLDTKINDVKREKTIEKETLSFNKIKTFLESPINYFLSIESEYRTKELNHFKRGLIIHKVLEKVNNAFKFCKDYDFKQYLNNQENLDEEEIKLITKQIKNYIEFLKKSKYSVLNVEKKFEIDIKNVTLTGKIDLIVEDDIGNTIIIDIKSGSKKKFKSQKVELQLVTYKFYGNKYFNKNVKTAAYSLEDSEIVEYFISCDDLQNLQKRINKIATMIKNNDYPKKFN